MDPASTGITALTARFTPGRRAVVCYVPLGDPILEAGAMLDAYADAGVDVLEVGIPTARPWLDGPEVTGSMARALAVGADASAIGRILAGWRRSRARAGRPVPATVWFGYPDIPLDALRDAAAAQAIDGLLLVEPHRHADAAALDRELRAAGVARCAFLPWEPTDLDLHAAAGSTGYVMVQARPGLTGSDGAPADPEPLVRLARDTAPGRPVVAGFGVSTPGDVARIAAAGVDGVVIGSACIRAVREGGREGLRAFLRSLVAAARPTAS